MNVQDSCDYSLLRDNLAIFYIIYCYQVQKLTKYEDTLKQIQLHGLELKKYHNMVFSQM